MNCIYKLKFDKRRRELVVVSEIMTGAGKTTGAAGRSSVGTSRRIRHLPLTLLAGLVMMSCPALAGVLPSGGSVAGGQGGISTSGTTMTVTQNSQNMVINWNSFDIGSGYTVTFSQPSSSAAALNRVTGGSESVIAGTLNANGQVFLVNPNGVLFSDGASVNTGGFMATTRDITPEDFMAGKRVFTGTSDAEIVNQGNLTTSPGGFIVLAAGTVRNSGTISSPSGKAVLASGETVSLQMDSGGLTSVNVSGETLNALVENSGLVSAPDGQVYLTALGKDMVYSTVLNVSGVVEATGLSGDGGSVVLDGGSSGVVVVCGTLDASSDSGRGGTVVVQGENILLGSGSVVNASGGTGGGEVLIGGGWQGSNSTVRNAAKTVVQDGAVINVSAGEQGNGGTAVLWSDEYTVFSGEIYAKGGNVSGDGGQVETSSQGILLVNGSVNASAAQGAAGSWLLDPTDVEINSNTAWTGIQDKINNTNDTTNLTNIFTVNDTLAEQGKSWVLNTTIENDLNNGTSVIIRTSSDDYNTGSELGNITVNSTITKTNGSDASLTLDAVGHIFVKNNITSTVGKLNITLDADKTVNISSSTLNSNGGNITLNGTSVGVTGSNITTNGGDVNITASNNSAYNVLILNNSNISAVNGSIYINASSAGSMSYYLPGNANGTASLLGNLSLLADNITINAKNDATITNKNNLFSDALYIRGNISFTGNTTIVAESQSGSGIIFGVSSVYNTNPPVNLTFTNGTVNINATSHSQAVDTAYSAIAMDDWRDVNAGRYVSSHVNVILNNSDLTIDANSDTSYGISGKYYEGYTGSVLNISGTGNVSINSSSTEGDGIYGLYINNTNLNGSTYISGESVNGSGVNISGALIDTTVTGTSTDGTGTSISGNSTLTDSTVNGTSVNSTGAEVGGDSTLINTTVNGLSANGTGTDVTDNSNVTSGSNITGTSTDGTGTSISGNSTVNGSSVSGSTTNGTGVDITDSSN
ncbi:TPA: filamentous hemagglutinin N-terminal domain-containing protein, partial [Escherichia coli]|nr:filamentous hemagglutinin N-terminal domain-containing protein [Escherichia coli]